MNLLEEIEDHPICGDGAMGTVLMERGVTPSQCFEELCLSRPALVIKVHEDYVAAGARLIETNTFGANAVRLARYGLEHRVNEINWQAAQLAKQAAGGAFVAGSIGPLGLPSSESVEKSMDREECFRAQMGALLEGGVDLIFLETFQDLDELLLALHVKHSLHHCPTVCSLTPGADGRLPGGLQLEDAFRELLQNDAEILGINCVNGPDEALRLLEQLTPPDAPLAVFPNAGLPRFKGGRHYYEVGAERFAEIGALMVERGVRIIGGCCGTNPSHIAALTARLPARKTLPNARERL